LESTEPVNSSIPSSSMQLVGGDEAELDNIPDLSIDDESQDPVLPDSDKTSKPTGPTVSHGDETEEVLKILLDFSPLYAGFQVSNYRFQ
jgi:hypothetical protein